MGFKTNRKTGNVFNDNKQRSDKHHGSVKPKSGIKNKKWNYESEKEFKKYLNAIKIRKVDKNIDDMSLDELKQTWKWYKRDSNDSENPQSLVRYHDEMLTELEYAIAEKDPIFKKILKLEEKEQEKAMDSMFH